MELLSWLILWNFTARTSFSSIPTAAPANFSPLDLALSSLLVFGSGNLGQRFAQHAFLGFRFDLVHIDCGGQGEHPAE